MADVRVERSLILLRYFHMDDLLRRYGLPDLIMAEECCRSMLAADFELLEARDRALEGDPETPWYSPQVAKGFSIRLLARSPMGRRVINQALGALVVLCPSARGMRRASDILDTGADATIEGGRLGILTTLFFMLSRKPGGDARTSSRTPRPAFGAATWSPSGLRGFPSRVGAIGESVCGTTGG